MARAGERQGVPGGAAANESARASRAGREFSSVSIAAVRLSGRHRRRSAANSGRRGASSRATARAVTTAPPDRARQAPDVLQAAISRSDPLGADRRRHASAGRTPERRRTPGGRGIPERTRARRRHHRRRDRPLHVARRRCRSRASPRAGTAGRRPSPTRGSNRRSRPGSRPISVPKLSLKWAFGFPTRRRPGRSRPSPAAACSSAARTAPSMRSTRPAAASTGRSRRRAASGRRCRSGRAKGRRLRRVLRRHRRERLRARRGNGTRALVAPARRTSVRANHRIAHAVSGIASSSRSPRWRRPPQASRAMSAARSAAA